MLNIYEHYREHGWGDDEPLDRVLADLAPHRVREEEDAAGSPVADHVPRAGRSLRDVRLPAPRRVAVPAHPRFGLAGRDRAAAARS